MSLRGLQTKQSLVVWGLLREEHPRNDKTKEINHVVFPSTHAHP